MPSAWKGTEEYIFLKFITITKLEAQMKKWKKKNLFTYVKTGSEWSYSSFSNVRPSTVMHALRFWRWKVCRANSNIPGGSQFLLHPSAILQIPSSVEGTAASYTSLFKNHQRWKQRGVPTHASLEIDQPKNPPAWGHPKTKHFGAYFYEIKKATVLNCVRWSC